MRQISFCVIRIWWISRKKLKDISFYYRPKDHKKPTILHRANGPAFIALKNDQYLEIVYFNHGIIHKEFSPAKFLFKENQDATPIWYINGHDITNDINNWLNEKNILLSRHTNWSIPDEFKAEFKLRFH